MIEKFKTGDKVISLKGQNKGMRGSVTFVAGSSVEVDFPDRAKKGKNSITIELDRDLKLTESTQLTPKARDFKMTNKKYPFTEQINRLIRNQIKESTRDYSTSDYNPRHLKGNPERLKIVNAINHIVDTDKVLATRLYKIIPSKYEVYDDWPDSLWTKVGDFLKKNKLLESTQQEQNDIAVDLIDYIGGVLKPGGYLDDKRVIGFFRELGITDRNAIKQIYSTAMKMLK